MSCWHFRSDLANCPALAAGFAATISLFAGLPWIAGVPDGPATALTALALAGLPTALRSVPGRWCPVQAVSGGPEGLVLHPGAGLARTLGDTRVLPGLVLLHAEAAGRRFRLWIPRAAMPAGDFRRLKAFLHAGGGRAGHAA